MDDDLKMLESVSLKLKTGKALVAGFDWALIKQGAINANKNNRLKILLFILITKATKYNYIDDIQKNELNIFIKIRPINAQFYFEWIKF